MSQIFEQLIFVDTSAVIAFYDPKEQYHSDACRFVNDMSEVIWATLNATLHETYTLARSRYDFGTALCFYDWLLSDKFEHVVFEPEDEVRARELLEKYCDQDMSFHDVLLASVMLKKGAYRIFTFDHHFWSFGFQVVPGLTQ